MPKSRKRGGEKAHRKRVVARNQKIGGKWKRLQKSMLKTYEEFQQQSQQSGSTEENVVVDELQYNIRTGKQFYFKETNQE
jgi:hypothetical protein